MKIIFSFVFLLFVAGCNDDPLLYTVTPSGTNVTISPSSAQRVAPGTTQAFEVTVDTGYTLDSSVGGTCGAGTWNGGTYTTGIVTADCTVSFSATVNTHTVTSSGTNVTISPSAAQTVNYGSTQSFTVTASTGYTTDSSVGGTCAAGSWSGGTYTTGAVTANCTVSFSASVSTYTVTPSVDAQLSSSPSSAQTVTHGSTQSFAITASSGYAVNSTVGGTCAAGSWSAGTYTTGAITANCSVSFTSAADTVLTNLQALWHLDGTVGTISNGASFTDASGNGYTGTVSTSGTKFSYATALFSQGLTTQSTSTAIATFGTTLGNFGTSAFSVGFWLKSTSSANTQHIINKRSICGHQSFWGVYMAANGRIGMEVDQDGAGTNYNSTVSTTTYNDGNWHHVVAWRSAGTVKVYVDTVEAATATVAGTANISNAVNFNLGNLGCTGTTQPLIGTVDEVGVWDRALTTTEISRLYSLGPVIP